MQNHRCVDSNEEDQLGALIYKSIHTKAMMMKVEIMSYCILYLKDALARLKIVADESYGKGPHQQA